MKLYVKDTLPSPREKNILFRRDGESEERILYKQTFK